MAGKLDLGEASKLLALDFRGLQREVYLMLPVQDKEDHQYLIFERPKPVPTPQGLFMQDEINIQQYEDLVLPGKPGDSGDFFEASNG
jgi:hypothetical protein